MKQKALQWFLAAILIVCGAMTTLTSCSDDDDKVVNPLGDKIIGIFHQAYDTEGTLSADLIDNSDGTVTSSTTRTASLMLTSAAAAAVWVHSATRPPPTEPSTCNSTTLARHPLSMSICL